MLDAILLNCPKTDKDWGFEIEIVNNSTYCLKYMSAKFGRQSSLHHHEQKRETFFVLRGGLWVFLNGGTEHLRAGQMITIEPGEKHRFTPSTYCGCNFYEVSTHHSDADVFRDSPSGVVPDPDWCENNEGGPPRTWPR